MSILINGSPFGNFFPSKGLCQGDPLSPYLFIVAMEVLSHLLHCSCDSGLINGITLLRGGLNLAHLFLANDLIMFGKANMQDARNTWDCLLNFYSWCGQFVTTLKIIIFFNKNTLTCTQCAISSTMGISDSTVNLNYLGLPLFRRRRKKEDF